MTDQTTKTKTFRFSESPLWEWQRTYFEKQGIKAWQLGEVPHAITCSTVMARAYAAMVFAFLRDRARLHPGNTETVYLLEPGAGSGKLAFRVLKQLEVLCAQADEKLPAYCYVLSDFASANVDAWKNHPKLQPYIAAGMLDVALFDAVKDKELHLQYTGKHVTAGSLAQPLLLIANYFFDSIPQDLFYISSGKLHEVRVAFKAPETEEHVQTDAVQSGLQITYSIAEAPAAFYPEESFNTLLRHYTAVLNETHLFFPHTGIRCLQNLGALSREGFLLLSADKGEHREERLDGFDLPVPDRHGSFSFSVNYHAIKKTAEEQGAATLFSRYDYNKINVCGIVNVPQAKQYRNTINTYYTMLEDASPDDYHTLQEYLLEHAEQANIGQLLVYVRITHYDSDKFERIIPRLMQLAEDATPAEAGDLSAVAARVWDNHYPMGEKNDLAFQLGIIFYLADRNAEALHYFEQSLSAYGSNAPVYYNMASCYFELEQPEQAAAYASRALELDAGHEGALFILSELNAPQANGEG